METIFFQGEPGPTSHVGTPRILQRNTARVPAAGVKRDACTFAPCINHAKYEYQPSGRQNSLSRWTSGPRRNLRQGAGDRIYPGQARRWAEAFPASTGAGAVTPAEEPPVRPARSLRLRAASVSPSPSRPCCRSAPLPELPLMDAPYPSAHLCPPLPPALTRPRNPYARAHEAHQSRGCGASRVLLRHPASELPRPQGVEDGKEKDRHEVGTRWPGDRLAPRLGTAAGPAAHLDRCGRTRRAGCSLAPGAQRGAEGEGRNRAEGRYLTYWISE